MEVIMGILGYTLIWAATDIGRDDKSKLNPKQGKWWLMAALIFMGCHIIKNIDSWFNAL